MQIKLQIKSVYGREMTYPACNISRAFAEFAGRETFTIYHLAKIKELGYEFEYINAYQPQVN